MSPRFKYLTNKLFGYILATKNFPLQMFKTIFFSKKKKDKRSNKTILMLTISQIEIDPRINKVAKSLAEAGYTVKIMVIQRDLSKPAMFEETVLPNVSYIRVNLKGKYAARWSFYQDDYYSAASNLDFDFVHANDLTTLFTGWMIAKTRGCPLIYDAHEMWSDNVSWNGKQYVRMSWLKRFLAKFFEKKLLQQVDCFFSVSPSILNEYERAFQRRPLLLANYPHIPDLDKSNAGMQSVREILGLSPEHFITIYIGGLGPARNIEKVIAAHQYLDDKFVFVIRGPSMEIFGPQYKAIAKSLGIEHRILVLPGVGRDEIITAVQGADCGIVMLENLSNNFYWFYPNKFFEYSLAGLPVAVSNFPDVSAHIQRERNGITFDPSDPKSIAQSLEKLANNMTETLAMGRRGRDSIFREYNWEKAVQLMIAEYDRL